MCRKSAFTALCLCATLLGPALLAQPGPPPLPEATVTVDCDAGDTLAVALETRAEALTIEFTGTCAEELVITRDRLTIRGLDASATVTDDPATSGPDVSFLLQGADVTFESFTVDGAANRGIRVQRSSGVQLEDMTVRNNGSTGLTIEESSSVHIIDSTFTGNAFAGVAAWGNSNVTLTGSLDVSNNSVVGLLLSTGSSFMNRGGTVIVADGQSFGVGTQQGGNGLFPLVQTTNTLFGVVTFGGAHFGAVDVTGAVVGVFVTNHGSFDGLADISAFFNAIQLIDNSNAFLRGGTLSAPTGMDSFNSVTEVTDTTFTGDVRLGFNAQAFFNTSSTGGVVICDPTAVAGGTLTCPSSLTSDPAALDEPRAPVPLPHPLPLMQPE